MAATIVLGILIAADCGFRDMSYFSKAFREIFKVTPTDYRKNLEMI